MTSDEQSLTLAEKLEELVSHGYFVSIRFGGHGCYYVTITHDNGAVDKFSDHGKSLTPVISFLHAYITKHYKRRFRKGIRREKQNAPKMDNNLDNKMDNNLDNDRDVKIG